MPGRVMEEQLEHQNLDVVESEDFLCDLVDIISSGDYDAEHNQESLPDHNLTKAKNGSK